MIMMTMTMVRMIMMTKTKAIMIIMTMQMTIATAMTTAARRAEAHAPRLERVKELLVGIASVDDARAVVSGVGEYARLRAGERHRFVA